MGTAAKAMNSARLITLTAPHLASPLADQLAALRRAFARLRASAEWKRAVCGGLYAIEVTFNASRGEWHPHLHVLCDGEYFDWRDVREQWRLALNASKGGWSIDRGDPLNIRIELIRNRRDAVAYVAKYLCKPSAIQAWPLARIREWAEAMHGQRLLHTFGTLHGANLDPADTGDAPEKGRRLASLLWLAMGAGRGVKQCVQACQVFRLLWPDRREWVPDVPAAIAPGVIRQDESIAAAFVRLAEAGERAWWAAAPAFHRGDPPEPDNPPRSRVVEPDPRWW
jgi:hypothetical protein